MGTLTGSSGNEALSAGARVTGSFITTSNMLRFNRSLLSSRGQGRCRALVLLYRTSLGAFLNEQCTSGGPWPVPLFLHDAPLNNLKFLGIHLEEDVALTYLDRAEWTTSHLSPLYSWHPEGCGLPVGQPFDFDVVEVLVLRAKKGSELPPPFWHSFILL